MLAGVDTVTACFHPLAAAAGTSGRLQRRGPGIIKGPPAVKTAFKIFHKDSLESGSLKAPDVTFYYTTVGLDLINPPVVSSLIVHGAGDKSGTRLIALELARTGRTKVHIM